MIPKTCANSQDPSLLLGRESLYWTHKTDETETHRLNLLLMNRFRIPVQAGAPLKLPNQRTFLSLLPRFTRWQTSKMRGLP